MPASTAIISWAQTSNTTPGDLGIITVTGAFKLLRVEMHGAHTDPITTATTSGSQLNSPFVWGIQAIPHGNTPLALPANITAADWLVVQAHEPGELGVFWAPSTDTVAFDVGGGYHLRWSGQQAYAASTDIIFTTGQWTGFSTSSESFGTMRIWYD
jgi:hypothetical protein